MAADYFKDLDNKKNLFDLIALGDDSRFRRLIKDVSADNARSIFHEETGLSMLHWASLKGAVIIQNFLIDKMGFLADMDNNRYVWSPAHVAVIGGQEICLDALLIRKPDVINRPDKRGCTPLHLAASHGRSHCMTKILKCTRAMPQLNKQCARNAWTPLMYATWHGRISCVELLIRHGAVTDLVDNDGRTPLHIAAAEGHLPLVKYISEHGCKDVFKCLSDVDNNGFTPAQAAEFNKKVEITAYLNAKLKDPRTWEAQEDIAFPGNIAAMNGDIDAIKNLINKGYASINDVDLRGYSMLHKASLRNQGKVVLYLMDAGASLHLKTLANETALDIAKRKEYSQIIDILEREELNRSYIVKKKATAKNIYVPILSSMDVANPSSSIDGQRWHDLVKENEIEFIQLTEVMLSTKDNLSSEEMSLFQLDTEPIENADLISEKKRKIASIKHDIIKLQFQTEVVKFNLYQLTMQPTLKEIEIGQALADCENQFEEISDQLFFEKEKREQTECELSKIRTLLLRMREYILTNDVADDLLSMVLDMDAAIIGKENVPMLNFDNLPVTKNKKHSIHFEVDENNKINIIKVNFNPMPKDAADIKTNNLSRLQFVKYMKVLLNTKRDPTKNGRHKRIYKYKRHPQSPIGGIFVTK